MLSGHKSENVIEGMCATGMSLEGIQTIFKQFDKDEIEGIFDEYHFRVNGIKKEEPLFSINCS